MLFCRNTVGGNTKGCSKPYHFFVGSLQGRPSFGSHTGSSFNKNVLKHTSSGGGKPDDYLNKKNMFIQLPSVGGFPNFR